MRRHEAWWDVSAEGPARSWEGEVQNVLKPGPPSPLLKIVGGESPSICQPDVLHCFNLGVGADLAIGGILAMHRMKLWDGRNINTCLNNAYERFHHWCVLHGKTAAIKCFDLGKFHMTSFRVLIGTCLLVLPVHKLSQSLYLAPQGCNRGQQGEEKLTTRHFYANGWTGN